MLVLKRQVGEKLVIGNEITIEVLSVSGDGVRLGIVAPRETSVHRYEIFEAIQAVNQASYNRSGATPHKALTQLAAHLRGQEDVDPPLPDRAEVDAPPALIEVAEKSPDSKGMF